MTVTKRQLLKALEGADDDAVIFVDNGVDCLECRSVERVTCAALLEFEHISTQADASFVPDGSVVLRIT